MNAIDGFKEYLDQRCVNAVGQKLYWDDGLAESRTVFSRGWMYADSGYAVELSYHLFGLADVDAAMACWDSVSSLYKGIEAAIYSEHGHLDIYCMIRSEEVPAPGELAPFFDDVFARMSEAVFSLMSRYGESLRGEDELAGEALMDFSNEARTRFVSSFLPKAYGGKELSSEEEEATDMYDDWDEIDDADVTPYESHAPMKLEVPEFRKPCEPGNGGFASIAGMEELKASLEEKVLWMLGHREQAERYRITMPSGMLLYGPPGCGKTYFAERFAEESGLKFMLVRPSDLADRYLHGTQDLIGRTFSKARRMAPCILCFDELDALVPDRRSEDAVQRTSEVNEFLVQMNDAGKYGVFVIGTTNLRESIDPAVLRTGRLDIQVEIPAPDLKLRKSLFSFHLDGRPLSDDIDLDWLAVMTDGYASSDITAIVNTAAIKAARADVPIGESHLEAAVRAIPSSLKSKARRQVGFAVPCPV